MRSMVLIVFLLSNAACGGSLFGQNYAILFFITRTPLAAKPGKAA